MRSKRVTISDIAEAAGVSHPTVSRVLAGDARISAPTVQRVKAAAKKLGYRPNRLAQGFKDGKTGLIGVLSDRGSWILLDLLEGLWMSGLHDAAKAAGYRLLLNLPVEFEDRGQRNQVRIGGVEEIADGMVDAVVIIGGNSVSKKDIQVLKGAGLPVVFMNLDIPIPGFHQHLSGLRERFTLATTDLLDRGCKRVGVLGVDAKDSSNGAGLAVMQKTFSARGMQFNKNFFRIAAPSDEHERLRMWNRDVEDLVTKAKVDAILCFHPMQVLAAQYRLKELGIPRDKWPILSVFAPLPLNLSQVWEGITVWEANFRDAGPEVFKLVQCAIRGEKPQVKALKWFRADQRTQK